MLSLSRAGFGRDRFSFSDDSLPKPALFCVLGSRINMNPDEVSSDPEAHPSGIRSWSFLKFFRV